MSALRSGELSLDQVAVVAAHTPLAYEAAVAEFARSATVSQLRRTLRHHHFGVDPPEVPGREPNGLSQGFDGDGRYRLRAVLDADEGAIVRQALAEAHDALFRAGDGRVDGADALVEMARRSLATVAPLARRDAFLAIFHVPVGLLLATCMAARCCRIGCGVSCCATVVGWWSGSATAGR